MLVAHTRSGSWKMPCVSIHTEREGKAADSSSCPAMVRLHLHSPGPQNLILLEQLSMHLTVIICSVPLLHPH